MAEGDMAGYSNVLVAVDLAGENDPILQRAVERVVNNGTLSIVHVLEPAYFYYGMEPALGALPDTFEADMLKRAKEQLEQVSKPYGIPPQRQYLERGHAATQILRLAEDKAADLIVVGSHGRHGWRLILGSTANAVMHGARCDVLAVSFAEQ
jgi:universal stress protein A